MSRIVGPISGSLRGRTLATSDIGVFLTQVPSRGKLPSHSWKDTPQKDLFREANFVGMFGEPRSAPSALDLTLIFCFKLVARWFRGSKLSSLLH